MEYIAFFSFGSALFIINKKWGGLAITLLSIMLCFYFFIKTYQVIRFHEQGFTVVSYLDKNSHFSYEDIEQVCIATFIKEKKRPKKWIVLLKKDQLNKRIRCTSLEGPINENSYIGFPYSKRREKIIDRFFAGKKKYAIIHESTGEIEEIEPS